MIDCRAVSLAIILAVSSSGAVAQSSSSSAPIGGTVYDQRGKAQGEIRPAPGAPSGTQELRGPRGEYRGDLRPTPGGGYEIRDERGRYKGEVRPSR